MKAKHLPLIYLVLLAAFTLYIIADTFLIPRAYSSAEDTVTQTAEAAAQDSPDESAAAQVSDTDAASAGTSAASPAPTADTSASSSAASNSSGSHGPGSHSAPGSSGASGAPGASGSPGSQSSDTSSNTDPVDIEVSSDAVVTDTSYADDDLQITLTTYREYDTDIYVADVTVSSPDVLRTALADDTYGRNIKQTCSEIAEEVGAVLAINGDYYGAQESGYVLRNGTLYRSTAAAGQEDLVIWEDGSFSIIKEDEITAEELLEDGAQQVLSFGPALLENGTIQVTENEEVGKARTSNPRTAIGIVGENHYLLVVADGRTSASAGLTLYELAEFMQSLGAQTAYNLDGGGSSTMVFMGEVVNNPTSSGRSIKEREISDIIYVK